MRVFVIRPLPINFPCIHSRNICGFGFGNLARSLATLFLVPPTADPTTSDSRLVGTMVEVYLKLRRISAHAGHHPVPSIVGQSWQYRHVVVEKAIRQRGQLQRTSWSLMVCIMFKFEIVSQKLLVEVAPMAFVADLA